MSLDESIMGGQWEPIMSLDESIMGGQWEPIMGSSNHGPIMMSPGNLSFMLSFGQQGGRRVVVARPPRLVWY